MAKTKKRASGAGLDRQIKSTREQIAKIKKARRAVIATKKKATKLKTLRNRLKSMKGRKK